MKKENRMSQGAENSLPPEVEIEPGLQDLKANNLPRRLKASHKLCLILDTCSFGCLEPMSQMSQGADPNHPMWESNLGHRI